VSGFRPLGGRRHVLVMAKAPVEGRVKTRLCPPCTPAEAAVVAEAALSDTLEAVARCRADRRIIALDGEPGPWLPPTFEVLPQRGGRFDERLANAWADAGGDGIQIGMDTPHVGPGVLDGLLDGLDGPGRPAVLGHASDGGWWVIGLAGADPFAVFRGIPVSTPITGQEQERRLRACGFRVVAGPVMQDIDTWADLEEVTELAPGTRTAGVARRLARDVVGRCTPGETESVVA